MFEIFWELLAFLEVCWELPEASIHLCPVYPPPLSQFPGNEDDEDDISDDYDHDYEDDHDDDLHLDLVHQQLCHLLVKYLLHPSQASYHQSQPELHYQQD